MMSGRVVLFSVWLGMAVALRGAETAAVGGAGHEYDRVKVEAERTTLAATLPATLTIDEKVTVREYSSRLFGLAFDWVTMDDLAVVKCRPDSLFPAVNPEHTAVLREMPLPLNRIVAEYLHWKMAVGPLAERKKHRRGAWDAGDIQLAGPVEWVKAIQAVDPRAEFVWSLNMRNESAEDARDLAEFLTGGPDTAWGRKRIACGLREPVKVAIWELGNELDWGRLKIPAEDYVALCRARIATIRQVQPTARFAALAGTAPWSGQAGRDWKAWHRLVLAELGTQIDYLAFHPYYHGLPVTILENYLKAIAADIAGSSNPKIGIFVSEHAKWPPHSGEGDRVWKKYWYQTHALVGCLDTAEWLLRLLYHPEVTAMTYHAHSAGPWGAVYRDRETGRLYGTGIVELFKLFGQVPFGARVVGCTLSGEQAGPAARGMNFTAAAVASGDELYVLMNNRAASTSRTVSCRFAAGSYVLRRTVVLSAPDLHSYNSFRSRPVALTEDKMSGKEAVSSFVVPSKSLVLLVLRRQSANVNK